MNKRVLDSDRPGATVFKDEGRPYQSKRQQNQPAKREKVRVYLIYIGTKSCNIIYFTEKPNQPITETDLGPIKNLPRWTHLWHLALSEPPCS